jgi:hypothetical protein
MRNFLFLLLNSDIQASNQTNQYFAKEEKAKYKAKGRIEGPGGKITQSVKEDAAAPPMS